MSDLATRIASRALTAKDFFEVGDWILYGKYKNKKGKVTSFGKDGKGNITVTVEPYPNESGRKQPKTLQLFRIWKMPKAQKPEKKASLNSLQWGEPTDMQAAKMALPSSMFPFEVSDFDLKDPPGLDFTVWELGVLSQAAQQRAQDMRFIQIADQDLLLLFRDLCNTLNVDYPDEELSLITEQAEPVILKLKFHWNRPRPYQVADGLGLRFHAMPSLSAKSPAYPSGHTIQAHLVAKEMTRRHPEHAELFKAMAEKISWSRAQAGYHWPSDLAYGEQIADFMWDNRSDVTSRLAARVASARLEEFMAGFLHRHPKMGRWARKIKIREKAGSGGNHGEARQHGNEIWVFDKFWNHDQKTQDWMMVHEIGHWVRSEGGSLSDLINVGQENGIDMWDTMSLPFGQFNSEEAFADSFASYHLDGDVKRRYPEWVPVVEYFQARVAATKYKNKKQVDKADGSGKTTVYEYSKKQVQHRNREKAKRVEQLRKDIGKLREQVKKDVKSEDPSTRLTALAVALIDETYERVGNDASAKEGHFGVTGWQAGHVSFSGSKATVSYVGKSGVKQKKTVSTPWIVSALKAAVKDKGKDENVLCEGEECNISASDVNKYLKPHGVTAKDIRGLHANESMKSHLKLIRKDGPKLPDDKKEREKLLKDEFKKALDEAAKDVGHEASTLKSQYLVPGLEDDYVKDGTINEKHASIQENWGDMLVATKSDEEKQEEKVEDLSKPAPTKKPPRHDLRKERVEDDDDDLKDKKDKKDTSMNYKDIGASVDVLITRQATLDWIMRGARGAAPLPPPKAPTKAPEQKHGPGDVWQTDSGFRAIPAGGDPAKDGKTFKSQEEAKAYAEGGGPPEDEEKPDSKDPKDEEESTEDEGDGEGEGEEKNKPKVKKKKPPKPEKAKPEDVLSVGGPLPSESDGPPSERDLRYRSNDTYNAFVKSSTEDRAKAMGLVMDARDAANPGSPEHQHLTAQMQGMLLATYVNDETVEGVSEPPPALRGLMKSIADSGKEEDLGVAAKLAGNPTTPDARQVINDRIKDMGAKELGKVIEDDDSMRPLKEMLESDDKDQVAAAAAAIARMTSSDAAFLVPSAHALMDDKDNPESVKDADEVVADVKASVDTESALGAAFSAASADDGTVDPKKFEKFFTMNYAKSLLEALKSKFPDASSNVGMKMLETISEGDTDAADQGTDPPLQRSSSLLSYDLEPWGDFPSIEFRK